MDPNTAMEAATEGAKALTKFQEILQKIFGPSWTKKQADADAYADARKLQTIRDNPDMEIIYANGLFNARQKTTEALTYRTEQRLLTEAIRHEENIENVLELAAEEIQCINVDDTPVNDDFIARLFDIVKDISDKDMQYIWAKILAGEIKQPGSFSFRTLETLRNLSQDDALSFQKILPLTMKLGSNIFITQDSEILEKYGVAYHDILLLDECGLLKLNSSTGMNFSLEKQREIYSMNRIIFFEKNTDTTNKLEYRVYPLTSAGRELYSILVGECNIDYAIDLAEDIVKVNSRLKIESNVYAIIEFKDDGTIEYGLEPIHSINRHNTVF